MTSAVESRHGGLLPEGFSLSVTHLGDAASITVLGDVDAASGPALHATTRAALAELTERSGRALRLDLTGVPCYDGAEAKSLIATYLRGLALGVRLTVVGAPAVLRQRLTADGMQEMLDVR